MEAFSSGAPLPLRESPAPPRVEVPRVLVQPAVAAWRAPGGALQPDRGLRAGLGRYQRNTLGFGRAGLWGAPVRRFWFASASARQRAPELYRILAAQRREDESGSRRGRRPDTPGEFVEDVEYVEDEDIAGEDVQYIDEVIEELEGPGAAVRKPRKGPVQSVNDIFYSTGMMRDGDTSDFTDAGGRPPRRRASRVERYDALSDEERAYMRRRRSSRSDRQIGTGGANRRSNGAAQRVESRARSLLATFLSDGQYVDEDAVAEALRIRREQTIIALRFLVSILFLPFALSSTVKTFVFGPIVDMRQSQQSEIFLNETMEERAFSELQRFEERLHFEMLIGKIPKMDHEALEEKLKDKALALADEYRHEGADALKNVLSDLFSLAGTALFLLSRRREVSVFKGFLDRSIVGMSDTAKSFIIIILSDILVGFHSPHGWEVLMENWARHWGIGESREFIFVFIATFPVMVDCLLKFWIFNYINRISPSSVATYRAMNDG
eukprot:tig00021352_g20699.t1